MILFKYGFAMGKKPNYPYVTLCAVLDLLAVRVRMLLAKAEVNLYDDDVSVLRNIAT